MAQAVDQVRLFRGQGQVFVAERIAGQPAAFEFIGNVSELMLKPQTEKIEHQESQTGYNSVDKVIERGLKVDIDITTDSNLAENLSRLTFGRVTQNNTVTVTGETHNVEVGKYLHLNNINVTNFVSLLSSGGATLNVDVDYEVLDLASGLIRILPTTTAIADQDIVTANYIAGQSETIAAFGVTNTEYWLRFNGLNSAEYDNPVIIDCFKVRFAPVSDMPLINDDNFAEYKQTGTCLYDSLQPITSTLGRFFSIRQLRAA